MICCTNPSCNFWVHMHFYQGKSLLEGDLCPHCSFCLKEVYPEASAWRQRHAVEISGHSIDGKQFVDRRSGKIKILTVRQYAKEHDISEDIVLNIAKKYCIPCRQNEFIENEIKTDSDCLISIVIAVLNGLEITQQAIQSIREHAGCHYELILVDNGSNDGTAEWINSQSDLTYVQNDRNCLAKGWNLGLSLAKGQVFMVLNNDIIIHEDGIKKLRDAALEYGIAGQTGGIIVHQNEWSSGKATYDPKMSQYVEGYCLTFRKDVFEHVGLFDEHFDPAYCEDSDWCLRAKELGYHWTFVNECINHLGQQTSKDLWDQIPFQKNQDLLKTKHSNKGLGKVFRINRMAALGDIIMALQAVHSLRIKYPLSDIFFSCQEIFQDLVDACLDVEYLPVDELIYTEHETFNLDNTYERFENMHPTNLFADLMGVILSTEMPKIKITKNILEWKDSIVSNLRKPNIGCGLRAMHRSVSNWRQEFWYEVCNQLDDMTFIFFDQEVNPQFDYNRSKDHMQKIFELPNIVNLTGKTETSMHVLAILKECNACLTVDTGITHLAGIANIPIVCLYACIPSSWRVPIGSYTLALQGGPCFPMWKHDEYTCLDEIKSEMVIHSLRRVIYGK